MRKKDIMQSMEMFREIVQEIDVSDIPVKYIAAASYLDQYGSENVVIGDDLDDLMERKYPYDQVTEINFLLDLKSIAVDISLEVTELFITINKRLADEK